MVKFLSCVELYETIQQKTSDSKEVLWICSPDLGSGAHKILSQKILNNPPSDIRFVFQISDNAVKQGEIDPYELQYLMEHFKDTNIKSHDSFHSNIYIFDNSALITSANFTVSAFENNVEAGLLLDNTEINELKNFFDQSLWQNAKPMGDLRKLKKLWNLSQKTPVKKDKLKKIKPHTKIDEWTDDNVNNWYIGVPNRVTGKTERDILKETGWSKDLLLMGDVGYNAFKALKLGDLTYLANLYKKRGQIEMELARVFDKTKVETDEGDLHFVCQVVKNYLLEREQFHELLKNMKINSRTCETLLNEEQIKILTNTLSSIKPKKKKKPKKPSSKSQKKEKPNRNKPKQS